MANSPLDQNSRPALTALSSVDHTTIVPLYADPVTHRLLTDSATASGTVTNIATGAGLTGGPITTTGTIALDSKLSPLDTLGTPLQYVRVNAGATALEYATLAAGSTVTSVSVVSANGLAGTVATATTTPAITLSTTVTGILQGNGTAISAATTTGSGSVVLGTTPTLATPVINGLPTGTGIASAATASTLVARDANGNIYVNNYFANLTSTVSAGGTNILTIASSRIQTLTGSLSQTFQLPDATTLTLSSLFVFNNNSSGSLIITNNGASTLYTVPAGGRVEVVVTNIGTANGVWDFHASAPGTVTWGSGVTGLVFNTALTTTPSINAGASSAANPSFIPQRGSATTGFGGDSTHLYGSIGAAATFTSTSSTFSIASGSTYQINGTQIAASNLSNGTTGSGAIVLANTPTLITPVLGVATVTSINKLAITAPATSATLTVADGKTATFNATTTFAGVDAKTLTINNSLTLAGTDATTMTFPTTSASVARTDAGQTFTGTQTFSQQVMTNNAITASANAATVPITSRISTVTNNSAATLTITITTTSAVDGMLVQVRVLDFSAVAQTLTFVNTENSTVSVPTTSNGSTTLPLSVLFQFNNATTKWRCLAVA